MAGAKSRSRGIPRRAKRIVRGAERRSAAMAVRTLARVPSVGAFPSGATVLARGAAVQSRDFTPRAETLMTGKRRSKSPALPLIVLQNFPQGEVALAERALQEDSATPNFLERVAARAAGAGDQETAVRLRRRALTLDPQTAHRHLALAESLIRVPQDGLVHDWIVGLSRGLVTHHDDEALKAFRRAYELSPATPYVLHQYGSALVAVGKVDEALPLLEMAVLKSPRQQWFLELAEIYRRPDVAEFEKAMTYYERVFENDPKNMRALSGIINAGTRGPMDWARIWRSVRRMETRRKKASPYFGEDVQDQLDQLFWKPEGPSQELVDGLLQQLYEESNRGIRLHPTVLGLVISRLQFARYFSAGFQLRQDMAQERTRTLRKKPITSPAALRSLMKSYVYLDDAKTAADLADPQFWRSDDPVETLQIQKMHADAKLMTGDAEPYINYSRKAYRRSPLTADDRMEKLIRGKRVALVGPAETGDRLGEIIDAYDVVVRPRYQPEFIAENNESQGSRTDITYYSGQDLTSLFASITDAAESGDIKVVNARPFSHAAHAHRELPWLRFYRHDFSLCFHGGSLGIQRIAYDLLQFEPNEVCIFNSDLYTGNSMFTAGWREGDTFGPYSHINDIVVSHDVKSEFKFMQALMSTGIVTAQGRAAEVLNLTPEAYVRAVEEAGVLR